MRYWSSLPHNHIDQTTAWVQSMIDLDPAESDDYVVTIDGRAIGKMGAYRLPEFGFILARDHWGQGVASEALNAFIEHRRQVDPHGRLNADVDPRNSRSLALLMRHGFTETGRAKATWVLGDEVCDSVYLSRELGA